MTQTPPRALLTVMEAARRLHVSDDTLRRQIRTGDLPAVQVGTTPTGRPRYRIPVQAVEERLGHSAELPALERLRLAFAQLSESQQEALIAEAVAWARSETPTPDHPRQAALSREEIAARVTERGRALLKAQD
ncbi:hypothetical protein GCM10017783_13930 [Deinococcus piscis]|uniref:Helix-turn-helix domain-containing protein n=1 Tax=Deinococcus piscis TaxID=394230 RepID=A0ABQ3K7P9_9DEIO|nr:helix-turn-helix domain-containing protein [Deinococcus piscis]GHG02839.1 hypothetical protein GCM10017783_13930 [Deinococcus piscis]